ncbi:hypothetical protein T06_6986 [Trichinella sp. T6]|nr:hypothetical protein T06_6986 [Trichinella sp. T6]
MTSSYDGSDAGLSHKHYCEEDKGRSVAPVLLRTRKRKNNEATVNRRMLQDHEKTTVVRLLTTSKMILVLGSSYLRNRIPHMHCACQNDTGRGRIGERLIFIETFQLMHRIFG